MTFIQMLLIALVQGVTEFLPISSSGHLIILPYLTGFEDQGPMIDIAVHVGSLLAIIYIWRVVEKAYLVKPPAQTAKAEAPVSMLVPAWLLAIANLYFGSHTDLSVGIATRAAAGLFGAAP